jgi:nitroimidazol reductase NimA-like FMN-containing flavoprotein (pyridoxamine 5'-phosphate oxidase superfamily)
MSQTMVGRLDDDQIDAILNHELVGRLACHARGRTYIVPIAFAFADGAIVAHSADGLKLQMMRENPEVCFEVDQIKDLSHWRSVVLWGYFEELRGTEADRARAAIATKLLPYGSGEATQTAKTLTHQYRAAEGALASVAFRLRITERSGRYEA